MWRRANRALHATKLIRKYFTKQEILQLLTSNFYSVLFYNSKSGTYQTLSRLETITTFRISTCSQISLKTPNMYKSFIDIHKSCERATPNQTINYKREILLHKQEKSPKCRLGWFELSTSFDLLSNNIQYCKIVKLHHWE